MGLDMYFTPINFNDGVYLRKANAIHNYIIENHAGGVDECQIITLDSTDLKALQYVVKAVVNDRSLAPKLLPTASGFFFGSTEYDDWYFSQLEHFDKELDELLRRDDWDTIQYQASW